MSLLPTLSWIFAIAGAACALLAFFGKGTGSLSRAWSDRLYRLSYFFMTVSIANFILRGFSA